MSSCSFTSFSTKVLTGYRVLSQSGTLRIVIDGETSIDGRRLPELYV